MMMSWDVQNTYLFFEVSWVSISRVSGVISIGGSRLLVLMPWKKIQLISFQVFCFIHLRWGLFC